MTEREMTLQEWVERLPEIHTARREYNALRSQLAVAKAHTANVEGLYILACNDRDALRQRLANTELELTHATKTCAEHQWRAEQAQALLAADRMLDLTPVGPGETVDDALSRQKSPIWEREPPHCPTCDCPTAADQPPVVKADKSSDG